jgi:hypothetical protein
MHLIPPLPEDVEIAFRYFGGPKDGEEVWSDEPVGPWAHTAEFLWITTRGATVGAVNWTPSEYTLREECEKASVPLKSTILPRHLYVLEKRIVFANKIVCVMTHQGVERRFD